MYIACNGILTYPPYSPPAIPICFYSSQSKNILTPIQMETTFLKKLNSFTKVALPQILCCPENLFKILLLLIHVFIVTKKILYRS